uniref:Uncharacterized protein n=1 Tax=Chromera velia CCMP2878 TaxID=1169474 RepID=A0A0G4F8H1_9ALVE|eukprot:Cvel_15708.t1-p1 / transcript=Cvel_15708.t1 / gene=Cvel_15708 / organism=Chromera_velia_CCMP2878 / gene_product=hypothetical protein / transcript_product=hypothetical protein / location=Cvel_scaffold1174:3259-3567(-) / protein_length=103 / sequence_SO=supercontig / SO=protein_coding / is_pseudo=false
MLLEAGADVDAVSSGLNEEKEAALERAVSTENLEAVNIFVSAGAKVATKSLWRAVSKKNLDVARVLVRAGVKWFEQLVVFAARKKQWGMVTLFVLEGAERPQV